MQTHKPDPDILTENPELIKQYFVLIVDALFAKHETKGKSHQTIEKDKTRNPELTYYIISCLLKHINRIDAQEATPIYHELVTYHFQKRNCETCREIESQLRLFGKKMSEACLHEYACLIDQLLENPEQMLQHASLSRIRPLICIHPKHEKFAKVMEAALLNLDIPTTAKIACNALEQIAFIATQKQQEEMMTKIIGSLKNGHEAKMNYGSLLCKLISNYSYQFNNLPNVILTGLIDLHVQAPYGYQSYMYELISAPAVLLQSRQELVDVFHLLDQLIAPLTYHRDFSLDFRIQLARFYLEIASAIYDDPVIRAHLSKHIDKNLYHQPQLQFIFKLPDTVKQGLSAIPSWQPVMGNKE